MLLGLKPGHACDSIECLSGVHGSYRWCITSVAILKDAVVKDMHRRNWLEAGWRTLQKVVDVEGTITVHTPSGICTESFNSTRGDEHSHLVVDCQKDPLVRAGN